MLKILYLPTYFMTQCAIYGTQIYLYSDEPHSGGFLVLVIVICNVLKECMTGALGIFILVFAHRLDSIINALIFEWGNTPPQIERIKTIRLFLLVMAYTFLTVNFSYNIIVPVINIIRAVREERTGDFSLHMGNFGYE